MRLKVYVLLVLLAGFSKVGYAVDSEQKLILAYVYNLAKFIEWPENSVDTQASINLCFYGDLGKLSGKTNVLDNKKVHNQPILTKEIVRGNSLSGCNVVFISKSEDIYLTPLIKKLKDKPVLTISNADSFIRADGMIALVYDNDKLRFDINETLIERSQMKASSQILRLARKVIKQ